MLDSKIRLAIVALAIVAAAALPAPAAGHECAAHNGCDAGDCPDGEDHWHTDYNYAGHDEYCASTEDGSVPAECLVAGRKLPQIVCDTIP